MKYIIILLLITFMSVLASCGDKKQSQDPKEFFVQANLSSLKVNDATFKATYSFRSEKENQNASLDVTLLRDKESKTGFIIKFKTNDGSGLFDGKKYYYLDNKIQKYYVTSDELEPEMFITQNWIINAIQMVMLNEDFTAKIKERKDEMMIIDENATLSTMKTTVVEAKLPITKDSVIVKIQTYFDKETKLPVKETKTRTFKDESVSISFEISNLKINQGFNKSDFVLTAPTGYATEVINPQSQPEPTNEMAEDFSLKDLDGKVITLSKLRGNVVVLDFWGTWCKWCVKAMPKLQAVHEHFAGKNVIVLGVSSQEPISANPKQFMKDNNVTYNSLKFGEEITAKYKVSGYPTLFVISKDGRILKSMSGFSETMDKELIDLIEKNL